MLDTFNPTLNCLNLICELSIQFQVLVHADPRKAAGMDQVLEEIDSLPPMEEIWIQFLVPNFVSPPFTAATARG